MYNINAIIILCNHSFYGQANTRIIVIHFIYADITSALEDYRVTLAKN